MQAFFSRFDSPAQRRFVKEYGLILLVAVVLWLVYAAVGPGDDYRRCYTWMVNEPERLPTVAQVPWTLNPPWLAPFMAPFVSLPGRPGYIVFMAVSIGMMILGTRVFKGKTILVLLSAQMFWVLWWGQIEGWAILGLVLARFAVEKKSNWLMFLALILASFKPQIGFVPVLAYWWWSGRDRWKPLIGMMALFGLSLLVWGPWPIWYAQGVMKFAGDGHANGWNASIGLLALPLFIPALLVPMEREKRVIALAATALLVSPYMPYYSTIILLILNIPVWAYFFAFTGYLVSVVGTRLAWNIIVFLPLSVLVWLYIPYLRYWTGRLLHKTEPIKSIYP